VHGPSLDGGGALRALAESGLATWFFCTRTLMSVAVSELATKDRYVWISSSFAPRQYGSVLTFL